MQIVIDIDEEEYKWLDYCQSLNQSIVKAIKNGTVLPEHGRLIDGDELKIKFKILYDFFINTYGSFSNLPSNDKSRVDEISHGISEIVNTPTILERTKEGE